MKKPIFLILSLLLIHGCAFIDQKVHLEYNEPSSYSTKIEKLAYLSLFRDNRSDQQRVGIVTNYYEHETADVITEQDVSKWISNAIALELDAAGFRVFKIDSLRAKSLNLNSDEMLIYGEVAKVFVKPNVSFMSADLISEIKVITHVKYNSRDISRSYSSVGHKRTRAWSADDYKYSLETALRKISREIVEDLILIAHNDG